MGYGDISPQTTEERLYVSFLIFGSCGMFGYIINSIDMIVKDMDKK